MFISGRHSAIKINKAKWSDYYWGTYWDGLISGCLVTEDLSEEGILEQKNWCGFC